MWLSRATDLTVTSPRAQPALCTLPCLGQTREDRGRGSCTSAPRTRSTGDPRETLAGETTSLRIHWLWARVTLLPPRLRLSCLRLAGLPSHKRQRFPVLRGRQRISAFKRICSSASKHFTVSGETSLPPLLRKDQVKQAKTKNPKQANGEKHTDRDNLGRTTRQDSTQNQGSNKWPFSPGARGEFLGAGLTPQAGREASRRGHSRTCRRKPEPRARDMPSPRVSM